MLKEGIYGLWVVSGSGWELYEKLRVSVGSLYLAPPFILLAFVDDDVSKLGRLGRKEERIVGLIPRTIGQPLARGIFHVLTLHSRVAGKR